MNRIPSFKPKLLKIKFQGEKVILSQDYGCVEVTWVTLQRWTIACNIGDIQGKDEASQTGGELGIREQRKIIPYHMGGSPKASL